MSQLPLSDAEAPAPEFETAAGPVPALPGGHPQDSHGLAPPGLNLPALQSSHSLSLSIAPAGAALPGRQVVFEQLACFMSGWYLPEGHKEQLACSVVLAKCPLAQG